MNWDQTQLDNKEWHDASRKLVQDFVSPVVVECENRHLITRFHFLFEPQLLLRLKCIDENACIEVKQIAERYFSRVSSIVRQSAIQFNDDYHGEAESYGGEENWLVMEDFLWSSSRFYVRSTTSGIHRGDNFTLQKFAHIFMNCNNRIPPLEEARTLIGLFCERMSYWSYDRQKSKELLDRFFDVLWRSS